MAGIRGTARGGARLRARLAYLWNDLDPDGLELLSAALSLTFALVLVNLALRGDPANALAHPLPYAALCLTASASKSVGVLLEWRWLRIAGLLLGTIFWITLSYVFLHEVPGSITWLCFAVLAVGQLWAVRRLVTP